MRYETHGVDPETGWTDWIPPKQSGYRAACCDCLLVHVIQFRIVKGEVQFRARRDDLATARRRRKERARADS